MITLNKRKYYILSLLFICASRRLNAKSLRSHFYLYSTTAADADQGGIEVDYKNVENAVHIFHEIGIDLSNVCHPTSNAYEPLIPSCGAVVESDADVTSTTKSFTEANRKLEEVEEVECAEEEEKTKAFVAMIIGCIVVCVILAALSAGLTVSLLSLDPLELSIKQRASKNQMEREYCRKILPMIEDHHRLLTSLLLLNSIANESMPLFLHQLVPSYWSAIISVCLVLLFGEVIPTAILTGPNQLAMASFMAPFVKFVVFISAPIALPISSLLDKILGHSKGDEAKYDRQELSTLVRIMYEKREMKKFADPKHSLERRKLLQETSGKDGLTLDEVNIVEGALKMKERTVDKVLTKWEEVVCVEKSTILTKDAISHLYNKGLSRIPVYSKNPFITDTEGNNKSISGVFMLRDLIMVDPQKKIKISQMPLARPECVSPNTNLVELLNKLQHGGYGQERGGHLAIVCHRPDIARAALDARKSIPKEALVIGIVTLEDVMEDLIQEDIYDETDSQRLNSQTEEPSGRPTLLTSSSYGSLESLPSYGTLSEAE